MFGVISLVMVVVVSMLVTRIATIALTHTGLSRESARFQARSALTGAGFTTNESEKVVNHPVRRRIVMLLMLVGNAGIVTGIGSLMLTFMHQGQQGWWAFSIKVALLAVSLGCLWLLASSAWVDRHLSVLIERGLQRYTRLNVRDYESLMQLAGDYRLVELAISEQDWLAGMRLSEADIRGEGLLVLAVKRANGEFVGVPHGDTEIGAHDNLVLYGHLDAIKALDKRRRTGFAKQSHVEATIRHRKEKEASSEPDEDAHSD